MGSCEYTQAALSERQNLTEMPEVFVEPDQPPCAQAVYRVCEVECQHQTLF
jgi:hypothetical protein